MDTFFNLDFQEKRLSGNISHLSKPNREKVVKAYKLAKKYHSGQKRDEGGAYILHCLRVTNCLIEELGIRDVNVICAALLHDAVEDTELGLSEIKKKFGGKASLLINNLTRKKLPDETELNRYQRKYQNFLKIMKKNLKIRAIKACDFLDNIVSCPKIPQCHPSHKKLDRWLKEAETIYLPLAKSVSPKLVKKTKEGLREVKKALEE